MSDEVLRKTSRLSAIIAVEPVSAGTPFPVDMLRHERAAPFMERDAVAIERTFDFAKAVADGRTRVWLECFWTEHGVLPRPYRERWISFGWHVVEVR